MKMKGIFGKLIQVYLCLTAILALYSLPVQAAKSEKIYTWRGKNITFSKDVTGDGKKDTIKVKATGSQRIGAPCKFTVFINGKLALSKKTSWFEGFTVQYLYIAPNKEFIQIIAHEEDGRNRLNEIYRYDKKAKKLACVLELSDYKKNGKFLGLYEGRVVSVSGNEIKVQQAYQPPETGWLNWKFTYTYKNGKFKLKSNTASAKSNFVAKSNRFRVANPIAFYTNTSLKKKAFTAKRNDILTLTKIKVSGGKAYLQFKKNGKTGWQKVGNYMNYSIKSRRWFWGVSLVG